MPKDVMEPGLVRLYQAPTKMVTDLLKIGLVVVIFWILKDWVFTKVYELSGWEFAKDWASISFLFWPTVILAGLAMASVVLSWLSTYYEIHSDRLVVKNGLISRKRLSIDMDQFTGVQFYQGMWGRLLGYGDIVFLFEVMTTVVTKKGIVLAGVRKPERLVIEAAKFIKLAGKSFRGKKLDKLGVVGVSNKPGDKEVQEQNMNDESDQEIESNTQVPENVQATEEQPQIQSSEIIPQNKTVPREIEETEVAVASEENQPELVKQAEFKPTESTGTIQGEIDFSKQS